jgi:hypothetical protein
MVVPFGDAIFQEFDKKLTLDISPQAIDDRFELFTKPWLSWPESSRGLKKLSGNCIISNMQ